MIKIVLFIILITSMPSVWANPSHSLSESEKTPIVSSPTPSLQSTTPDSKNFTETLKNVLGVTYFSFFYGPGVQPDSFGFSPNQLGEAEKHGLYFQNNVSFRYKFTSKLALDLQARFNFFLNNYTQSPGFRTFFWESPRIGISGKLLSGDDWSVSGAINTDFPYFLPEPLSGFEVQQRTVILNPGLFANFNYQPKDSRWSIFSVLSPRVFFYADRNAVEPSYTRGGYLPQNKPELIIALQPTVSYRIFPQLSLTLGTKIDYRKHVISSWNPLDASLLSNGNSPAWRIAPTPIYFGVTYIISPAITVYPFISTYPIAAQRVDATTGEVASLLETTSVGMWVRGTIF